MSGLQEMTDLAKIPGAAGRSSRLDFSEPNLTAAQLVVVSLGSRRRYHKNPKIMLEERVFIHTTSETAVCTAVTINLKCASGLTNIVSSLDISARRWVGWT